MPQTIEVPGVGQLQFPDGMSQADMATAIQKNFPQIHAPAAPDSTGVAQGKRMKDDLSQIVREGDANPVKGLLETAGNAATGIGSSAVGGLRGIWDTVGALANGKSFDDAMATGAKSSEAIQQAYTYQPKSGIGKLGSELVSLPFNVAKSALHDTVGDVGQAIGGAKGRLVGEALGDVAPDVYGTLAGGRAALKHFSGKAPVADVPPPANAPEDVPAPQQIATPTLPPSAPPILSPVEAYARQPIKSPYGDLPPIEPVAPLIDPSAPVTALDEHAAMRGGDAKTFGELMKRSNYEPNIDASISSAQHSNGNLSPLDSLIAGEPSPIAKVAAALSDTSDIDGVLAQFGVDAPKAAPVVPDAVPAPRQPMPGPAPAAAEVMPEVDRPFVATPEQHVDPAMRDHNLQVLRDVGLDGIRESAIKGDAATAAREYQHGKFDEPAGRHWDEQFKAETAAMKNYGQQLVERTKGRTGLDNDSLEAKGRDIAAPYDAARMYFEKAKAALYDEADKQAGGKPLENTQNIDNLLVDREFNNTALADKQLDLVKAVKQQFDLHKERNGGVLTVGEAEDFRKWLNKRWTPENSKVIGTIKDALDNDVFSSAGQDVYAAARQMHQLEMKTMDDPNGISKLMDSDPRAPMNRATPYENIPGAMVKLSNEQFRHIIDTYRNLPPELQPLAQQAIATLKAHYAERMVDAGTETGHGNPRALWNAGGVKKFAADNSGKLPMLFDADELNHIDTMLQAGEILRVNPAYPGAAAQLANARKSGMMTSMLGRAGGGIGGMVGAVMAGPAGAAAGGLAGEAAASSIAGRMGERAALARAKEAIVNEYQQPPRPRTAVDDWEDLVR